MGIGGPSGAARFVLGISSPFFSSGVIISGPPGAAIFVPVRRLPRDPLASVVVVVVDDIGLREVQRNRANLLVGEGEVLDRGRKATLRSKDRAPPSSRS